MIALMIDLGFTLDEKSEWREIQIRNDKHFSLWKRILRKLKRRFE